MSSLHKTYGQIVLYNQLHLSISTSKANSTVNAAISGPRNLKLLLLSFSCKGLHEKKTSRASRWNKTSHSMQTQSSWCQPVALLPVRKNQRQAILEAVDNYFDHDLATTRGSLIRVITTTSTRLDEVDNINPST